MKKYFDILLSKENWSSGRFSYFAAIATVIILPVNSRFLPPFMILLGLLRLIELILENGKIKPVDKKFIVLLFLFVLFYAWQLIGNIYSENQVSAWNNISRKLSLLIFPLVFISPGVMIKNNVKTIQGFFAAGTFAFIFFCFVYAFYRSIQITNGILIFEPHEDKYWWLNYFYGTYFAIFQHPSYLAMYVLLSIFISLESVYDISVKPGYRILCGMAAFIMIISLYFLSSRTGMLAGLLILPLYFIYKSVKQKRLKFISIFIFVVLIAVSPVILKNIRFSSITNAIENDSIFDSIKKDSRIAVWGATLNIVKENKLIGVGTGDVNDELLVENIKSGNTELVENRINVHNQFLEVLLANGIIGLILLLCVFGSILFIGISEKNVIYILFIIIVTLFFMFESMLNRLAGVSFFALFSFLLLNQSNISIGKHISNK